MINKISIFDLSGAISQSYKDSGYNAWITTVDEEDRHRSKRIKNNFKIKNPNFKSLYQFFYDWSDEDSDKFILQNIEEMGPSKQNVQNIISFIKDELVNSPNVYNLGINCFAGISRSTAVGMIAWVLSGKPTTEALDLILKVRPQAWPNLRILKFADDILHTDMFNLVKNWKSNNNGIYMPQGDWAW